MTNERLQNNCLSCRFLTSDFERDLNDFVSECLANATGKWNEFLLISFWHGEISFTSISRFSFFHFVISSFRSTKPKIDFYFSSSSCNRCIFHVKMKMTGAATKLNKHFEKGIFLCASLWQWTSNVTSLEGAHDEWTRFIAIAWLRLMYGKGTHLNINEEKRIYSFCEEVMDLFKNATSTICFGRNPSTLSYRRRRVGRFFFFFFSIFGALKQTWRIFQRPVNTVNLPHSTHSMFSCAYVKICWHIAFVSIHIDISTSSNEFELCWCVSAVVKLNASRHNLNHTEINVIYYASQRLDLILNSSKTTKIARTFQTSLSVRLCRVCLSHYCIAAFEDARKTPGNDRLNERSFRSARDHDNFQMNYDAIASVFFRSLCFKWTTHFWFDPIMHKWHCECDARLHTHNTNWPIFFWIISLLSAANVTKINGYSLCDLVLFLSICKW